MIQGIKRSDSCDVITTDLYVYAGTNSPTCIIEVHYSEILDSDPEKHCRDRMPNCAYIAYDIQSDGILVKDKVLKCYGSKTSPTAIVNGAPHWYQVFQLCNSSRYGYLHIIKKTDAFYLLHPGFAAFSVHVHAKNRRFHNVVSLSDGFPEVPMDRFVIGKFQDISSACAQYCFSPSPTGSVAHQNHIDFSDHTCNKPAYFKRDIVYVKKDGSDVLCRPKTYPEWIASTSRHAEVAAPVDVKWYEEIFNFFLRQFKRIVSTVVKTSIDVVTEVLGDIMTESCIHYLYTRIVLYYVLLNIFGDTYVSLARSLLSLWMPV